MKNQLILALAMFTTVLPITRQTAHAEEDFVGGDNLVLKVIPISQGKIGFEQCTSSAMDGCMALGNAEGYDITELQTLQNELHTKGLERAAGAIGIAVGIGGVALLAGTLVGGIGAMDVTLGAWGAANVGSAALINPVSVSNAIGYATMIALPAGATAGGGVLSWRALSPTTRFEESSEMKNMLANINSGQTYEVKSVQSMIADLQDALKLAN